jgi:quaternary ammonium compound-resistance protein SugE
VNAPKKEAKAMAWIYLFPAGLFEVAWAIGLKYNDGFSRFTTAAAILRDRA